MNKSVTWVTWIARATPSVLCASTLSWMFNGHESPVPIIFTLACVAVLGYEMGYKDELRSGRHAVFLIAYVVPFIATTALALWIKR